MFFGEYLIYKGKITQEELDFALKFQKDDNIINAISAVINGYLKYEDVSIIMDYMRGTGLEFGEAALNLRLLNKKQIEKIMSDKKKVHHQIGEILVMCGAISKIEMEMELRGFLTQFHEEAHLQPQINAA